MKYNKVPDGKGVITVQGHEEEVKAFRRDAAFLASLGTQVDEQKATFRELAAEVLEDTAVGVKRVEFLALKGPGVPVGVTDPSKWGNRRNVTTDVLAEAEKLGCDLRASGMIEQREQYTISNPAIIAWFQSVLQANYTTKGLAIPDGITSKTVTRLNDAGVQAIERMQQSEQPEQRELARLLQCKAISAHSVGFTEEKAKK